MNPYLIKISEKAEDSTKEILEAYWSIDNGKFVNKPSELSIKYQITVLAIKKLVKEHSSCDRLLGYCQDCNTALMETVYSQTAYSYHRATDRCDDCSVAHQRTKDQTAYLQRQEQDRQKEERFDKAISDRNWLKLSSYELDILLKIIQQKSKKDIYTYAFNGNPNDRSVWSVVNKLKNLGLISIDRNIYGSVNHFESDSRLLDEIKSVTEPKKQYELGFSLVRKTNRLKPTQAHYAGTFELKEDVILKAGVKYIYGGWVQTDESINLKFTPLESIQSAPLQTNLEDEPKLASDIIREMFNRLEDDFPQR